MGTITDYMYDTSYLEEVVNYLKDSWNIYALILDSEGQIVPVADHDHHSGNNCITKYYPFKFEKNLGGLLCSADNEPFLNQANFHIQMCIKGINGILQRELEFAQSSEEMLQLSDQQNFLFNLANKVIGVTHLKDFCFIILQEIARAIDADFAFIHNKDGDEKNINFLHNISEDLALQITEQESFKAISKDSTIIFTIDDGTSAIISPIKHKEDKSGYMAFFREKNKRIFTAYEKKFASIIDNIISPNIESLRLYNSLKQLYLNTVKALAAAIDAKDEYTHGHSFRVAKYSVTIGKQMTIPETALADLEIAAYMHDLGKIGVSEAILGKPGKLTDEEFTEIKKHPVLTHKILKPIHLPNFIVEAAVHHHERLNGRGYPDGLKGEEIPLYARIIAVADVFDALTSTRPYRDAMSVETALKILCDGIDKDFDRNIVLALVSALSNGKEQKPLAGIQPDLKYSDIHHMNSFLVKLTQFILDKNKD